MKNWRAYFLLTLFFLLTAAVFSRLVFLQVVKHELYKALGEGEQRIVEPMESERGEIFFSNGDPLALNKTVKYAFISPQEIKDKEETARELAELLDLSYDNVLAKARKSNYFEIIKDDLSEQEELSLKEKSLTGVYIDRKIERYYPQGEITAYITGFVGGEGTGQYGLEGFYDQELRGKKVITQKEKGPFGFLDMTPTDPKGPDIYTTVDPAIQFTAWKILSQSQERLGFKSGQILVMDPRSGAVLALAQYPSFDPNNYSETETLDRFQNNLVQKTYEPGSVFKPVTLAAAIDHNKVTPDTTYVDTGTVQIGGYTIKNYDERVWGKQTMTNVLENSINTGAVFAEKQLGHSNFLRYIEDFGLFEKTGLDLQGEVFSENREVKKGYEVNYATASFGQGISITPVQLARSFTAFTNEGKMVNPHLVRKLGDEQMTEQDKELKKVVRKETAVDLVNMLVSSTENGYAKGAAIEGYHMAGKTGTAQIAWAALGVNQKGYSKETFQTFVGFGPAYDPRFLVAVKLDSPQTKTASYSTTPIFKELAEYIVTLWEIPPSKIE